MRRETIRTLALADRVTIPGHTTQEPRVNGERTAGFDFAASAPEVARQLLGALIRVGGVAGRIVETEAYDAGDPASHSFKGTTSRCATMFGPSGRWYVYRSYGMHWCLNLVCGRLGDGAAVLLRALEPVEGLALMRERRGLDDERLLCAGPGRLCQALGVTGTHDGWPVDRAPFALSPPEAPVSWQAGPRVGISKAVDVPWRFGVPGSRYLSRPLR
jgi:DNA-3-methyladenine glycosylase